MIACDHWYKLEDAEDMGMSAEPDRETKGIIAKLTRSYMASSAAGVVVLVGLLGQGYYTGPRWTLHVVLGVALVALIGTLVYQTRLTRRLKHLKADSEDD